MRTNQTRQDELATMESELREILDGFRENVQAWSEVAGRQSRRMEGHATSHWRVALGWALGCVVVVAVAGGLLRMRRPAASAVSAPQIAMSEGAAEAEGTRPKPQNAETPHLVRVERAPEAAHSEDLLAKVDSDVSRQIPEALEPLAQWSEDAEP